MKNKEKSYYIFTLIFILTALTAMVTYSMSSFYSNAVSNMEAVGKSCLAQETELLNGYLTKGMDVLQVTAITVEYMMQGGASSEEIENFLKEESRRYMEDIDKNFTGIYGVFRGDYIDGIGWVPNADYVPYEREWYIAAMKAAGKPTIVSPYLDAQTNTIMISVSKLLYDGESVISFDIKMDQIQIITQNIHIDSMGYGFVVDKEGLIVAHYNENEKGKNYQDNYEQRELLRRIYEEKNDSFEMVINGEKCTVFKNSVMNDWFVAMVVSNTKLFHTIQVILLRNIIISIIVFSAIVLFCSFSFKRIRLSMQREEKSSQRLRKMSMNIVSALTRTIDAKDRYTNGHSQRVANYAVELSKRLGKNLEEQTYIYYAGLLHDVGKIRIPKDIINKAGKLTDEEFEQIKIHPVTGYHILKDIYEDRIIAEGAKFHHERYDGNGYPNGLQGNNIPEIARIIGIADAYDAMASNRSYRKALPQETVRNEIVKGRGTQFDPDIADVMLKMIDDDKEYNMKQTDIMHKTILVADDEPLNIEKINFIMEDEPMYNIIRASGGRETLSILSKNEVDLILLDAKMPDMDGFETLKHIRKKYSIPVIFMIDDKNIETIHKTSHLVDDYITKPFFPLALKEIVHSILNG